jgi:hypothetical protein
LKILDSSNDERFDRVTRMAKRIFDVSISLVSLIDKDRQWFKSKQKRLKPQEISPSAPMPSIKAGYLSFQTLVKMNDFLIIHWSLLRLTFASMQVIR